MLLSNYSIIFFTCLFLPKNSMVDHTIKERNNLKVEFTVQSTKYVQMLLKWGCNSEGGSSFLINLNTFVICEDLNLPPKSKE